MPKIAYKSRRFHDGKLELIERVNDVVDEYDGYGALKDNWDDIARRYGLDW